MKDGTTYARRLKRELPKLCKEADVPQSSAPDDPLLRLAIGVLGRSCGADVAHRAVNSATTRAVDWNELRVSTPQELEEVLGNSMPNRRADCRRLIDALQAVYDRENRMSLDRLSRLGIREAKSYLESLNGVDGYAVASVILWSLNGHAIPVDDKALRKLCDLKLVNPSASRDEVQAFLERHIPASKAKEFCHGIQNAPVTKTPTKTQKNATKKKSATKKKKAR